jgi:hypothetical protein
MHGTAYLGLTSRNGAQGLSDQLIAQQRFYSPQRKTPHNRFPYALVSLILQDTATVSNNKTQALIIVGQLVLPVLSETFFNSRMPPSFPSYRISRLPRSDASFRSTNCRGFHFFSPTPSTLPRLPSPPPSPSSQPVIKTPEV